MAKMILFEMKCIDSECGRVSLQELDGESDNVCPYCGTDTDYAPGRIEAVAKYTPRSERN
ncbi:hypothetical protein [Bacillus cereus group sp. IBL03679]|uniref:hypothetical protein n=1 Tax=Bacillus cereus group sp. IBL03679 TaxID=3240095 RepID=UPI003D2F687A